MRSTSLSISHIDLVMTNYKIFGYNFSILIASSKDVVLD